MFGLEMVLNADRASDTELIYVWGYCQSHVRVPVINTCFRCRSTFYTWLASSFCTLISLYPLQFDLITFLGKRCCILYQYYILCGINYATTPTNIEDQVTGKMLQCYNAVWDAARNSLDAEHGDTESNADDCGHSVKHLHTTTTTITTTRIIIKLIEALS